MTNYSTSNVINDDEVMILLIMVVRVNIIIIVYSYYCKWYDDRYYSL